MIDNQHQKSQVNKTIHLFSGICAGVAVQPIPFADIIILTPIQMGMGAKIAALHGVPLGESDANQIWKEILGAIGLGLLAQQIAIGLYKTILPFMGAVTTIPLVYGLTFGIGKVMDKYFEAKSRGQKLTKQQMKGIFKEGKKEGEHEGKQRENEIKHNNAVHSVEIKGTQHIHELKEAIASATNNLCILSGWISSNVIDNHLITQLKQAAQRGVCIYIGYGWIDSSGRHSESETTLLAERKLRDLQTEYPTQVFVGKYANHQKILIKDEEYIIIGSNNWLSNSTFRNNEISIKSYDHTSARKIFEEEKRNININLIV